MSVLNAKSQAGVAPDFNPAANEEADMYRPGSPGANSYAIAFANGPEEYFGNSRPDFTVSVPDRRFWRSIQRRGTYAAALAFVNGRIDISDDIIAAARWWSARQRTSVAEWLEVAYQLLSSSGLESFFQPRRRAAENISFHYDVPTDFYRCFLDENLVYSCAYFHRPSDALEHAQISKLEHICRKLELGPEDRFLDIGCGWGALALHAAKRFGVVATGCTLSGEQYAYAENRIIREGFANQVKVLQRDYRDVNGRFNKIASVGMFEHVGRRRLTEYFRRVWELLEEDGLFLNHGIIRPQHVADGPETLFLRKHVFPGGELAHLSEVVRVAEHAGFEIVDLENLRPHYALTCRHWVSRLQLSGPLAIRLVPQQVWRTWLLYLAGSAASFDAGHTDVYQLLMSKRGSRRKRHLTRAHIDGTPSQ